MATTFADLKAELTLMAELHPDSYAALLLDALDHGAADTSRVPQEHREAAPTLIVQTIDGTRRIR